MPFAQRFRLIRRLRPQSSSYRAVQPLLLRGTNCLVRRPLSAHALGILAGVIAALSGDSPARSDLCCSAARSTAHHGAGILCLESGYVYVRPSGRLRSAHG